MENKKILILTANFGAGHTSASNAIKKQLLKDNNSYEIIIKNFIEASVPILNKPMIKLYETQTKYMPPLYNIYYYTKKTLNSKYSMSYKMYSKNLSTYILNTKPDLIISTFPQASACINDLINKNINIKIPYVTVITDVVDSNEWLYPTTDMYFVPSHSVKSNLINKGISEKKIKVTGVPVDEQFIYENRKTPTSNFKRKILIMGGGRGLFDFSEKFIYWLDTFSKENKHCLEVTIITGKNERLYNKLKYTKPLKHIEVLGYIKNMPDYMKEYDLLISKAGGATLFEAINSQIPLIIKRPTIGQEIENSKFISNEKIGIIYKNEYELKKLLYNISSNNLDKELETIINNMHRFKHKIHSNKISDYIEFIMM